MREVPMRYVKANQTGIVLTVVLSFLFQQPWLLAALWVIQVVGLLTEGRFNVFVAIAKLILKGKGQEMQAAELQRFNNVLAILFLTIALILFSFGWQIAGYIFSAMLLLAAGAALLGYCIGCTIYFWFKQLRAGRSIF
jgi:cobalamin synthase